MLTVLVRYADISENTFIKHWRPNRWFRWYNEIWWFCKFFQRFLYWWVKDFRFSYNYIIPKFSERFAEFTSQKYRYLSLCKRVASENFSDNEISILIQNGALTIKSENSWYISTPYLGAFIRAYKAGQRGLLTIIKKTRFKELLLSVSSFCI